MLKAVSKIVNGFYVVICFRKKIFSKLHKHVPWQHVQNGCSENFDGITQKTPMVESLWSKTFLVNSQLFWYCCIRVRKSINMQTFDFADLKNIEGVLTILLEILNWNLVDICKIPPRLVHQFVFDHTYHFS